MRHAKRVPFRPLPPASPPPGNAARSRIDPKGVGWIAVPNARRTLSAVLVAGVLWAAGAAPARADESRDQAIAHFQKGNNHYKLSNYREELAHFKEAFLAKPDPALLFNIAQCHWKLGDRSEAVTFYRRYLRDVPNAPNRRDVEKRIAELEAPPPAASSVIASPPASGPPPSAPAPAAPPPSI